MYCSTNITLESIAHLAVYSIVTKTITRCEQGSNLRGKLPLDFKSNALTTRPSQLKHSYKTFKKLKQKQHLTPVQFAILTDFLFLDFLYVNPSKWIILCKAQFNINSKVFN